MERSTRKCIGCFVEMGAGMMVVIYNKILKPVVRNSFYEEKTIAQAAIEADCCVHHPSHGKTRARKMDFCR